MEAVLMLILVFKMKLSTQVIVMDIGDLEPGMKYF